MFTLGHEILGSRKAWCSSDGDGGTREDVKGVGSDLNGAWIVQASQTVVRSSHSLALSSRVLLFLDGFCGVYTIVKNRILRFAIMQLPDRA